MTQNQNAQSLTPSLIKKDAIEPESLSTDQLMTAHLLDILQFLAKPPSIDDASLAQAHAVAQIDYEPVKELSILLVGAPTLTQRIAKQLPTHLHLLGAGASANNGAGAGVNSPLNDIPLMVHQQDVETCLTSAFCQRFDLGVLLFNGVDEDTDFTYSPQQVQQIAIKFRDLLAEQSVLYVPKKLNNNFYALGYVLSDAHHALTCSTHWQTWQFNLFDYKPTPNWLNAKYWANPENFGKYRW